MEKKQFAIVIREEGVYQAQWLWKLLDCGLTYATCRSIDKAIIYDNEDDAIKVCQSIQQVANLIGDVIGVVQL